MRRPLKVIRRLGLPLLTTTVHATAKARLAARGRARRPPSRGTGLNRALLAILAAILLTGCVSTPPRSPNNLCSIFQERPSWYRAARASERRWAIEPAVAMAVMYQESSYVADARPPRKRPLWIIPWRRPSSAYGYAQATNETWADYKRATKRRSADRHDFDDAVDFIGWYMARASRELGIHRADARRLYLAYHDGIGGYRRGTWQSKGWLKSAAGNVATRATRYRSQLNNCRLRRWRLFG